MTQTCYSLRTTINALYFIVKNNTGDDNLLKECGAALSNFYAFFNNECVCPGSFTTVSGKVPMYVHRSSVYAESCSMRPETNICLNEYNKIDYFDMALVPNPNTNIEYVQACLDMTEILSAYKDPALNPSSDDLLITLSLLYDASINLCNGNGTCVIHHNWLSLIPDDSELLKFMKHYTDNMPNATPSVTSPVQSRSLYDLAEALYTRLLDMEQSSANMGKAYINMLRGGLGFWNDYSLNNIRPACRSEAYMQLRYKILPFAEDPDKYINTKIKDKTLINKACHKLEQMMHDDESNTASYIKSLYDITSGNKDLFDDYAIIRFDFTSTISAIARSTQELLTPDAFFSELLNKHEFYAYSTNPKNKLNLTAGMDGLFMTLKARLYNMQSMMTASVENNKQSAPNSFAEQAMNYTHLSQGQIIAMCDMLTAQLISIKETVPVSIESALDDLWTICNCNRVMELIMGKNCISLINTMYEDDEKSKNDILWSIQNMLNSKNMPDDVKTKSSARQYVKHATMLQLKLEPCN